MNLVDLLASLPSLSVADAKGIALVFSQAGHDAVIAAHTDEQHRAAPVQLQDGRWMLCADLLTEVHASGLYAGIFARLPHELFDRVEVIPWADAVMLVEQSQPQQIP